MRRLEIDNSQLRQTGQPGRFMECPACGRWHALELESTVVDHDHREVSLYHCTKCEREFEFASRRRDR